jgi:transcriptional regulator with XRE-family HTH domain
MSAAFASLLRRIRKRDYPTVQAFADALGIAPSQLSRAMSSRGQPFDIVGCLRLAKVCGQSPEIVLRAAGRHVVADLLHYFYGEHATVLSDEDRRLLENFHRISSRNAQISLLAIVDAMSDPHRMVPTSSSTPTPSTASVPTWRDRQGAG